jgi:deoxyribodipyrimidine photo-lyase
LLPQPLFHAPDAALVAGREVWLVHPWSLADPPSGLASDARVVAVADAGFHARWPWSAARWRFVGERLRGLAPIRWWGPADALVQALAGAARVRGRSDPHLAPAFDAFGLEPPPPAFEQPARRFRSFSAWWSAARCVPFQNQPELFTP